MENDSKRRTYGFKFLVGIIYGVPFPLTLIILDYWLKSVGVSNTVIGMFSFLQWPFALKFIWGIFIDHCDIPCLSRRIGRHRSWIVLSYTCLIIGILGMAFSRPHHSLGRIIFFASIVALSDGCKNVVMYPYQIDKCRKEDFGYVASAVGLGHRIGMLLTKIITLYIADLYSWQMAYIVAAILVTLSFILTLRFKDPQVLGTTQKSSIVIKDFLCFSSLDKHIVWILLLYKAADFMTQKMSRVLCIDVGFSPVEIANIVQIGGTGAVVFGTFIGGYLIKKFGLYNAMFIAGVSHAMSISLYVLLAVFGNNLYALTLISFCGGTTGGATTTAFIAFLYSISKNGTLYSLFWAIHGLGGIFFMTLSGFVADNISWGTYFLCAPLISIPGLLIITKQQKSM